MMAAIGMSDAEDDDGNSSVKKSSQIMPAKKEFINHAPQTKPAKFRKQSENFDNIEFPFGSIKGTKLKDAPLDEISRAVKWCRDKDKFQEFANNASNYLAELSVI
jgi:hypothetical protein